jgi:hypothetical protein
MTCSTCFCFVAATIAFATSGHTTPTKTSDTRCYELRTYSSSPEKLDGLQALKFFKKHGMETIGFWFPVESSDTAENGFVIVTNKLVYLLAYPNRAARETSWKALKTDPEWKAAAQKSEANGKIIKKVESVFLQTTDYTPALKMNSLAEGSLFELRTYTTPPGSLPNLDARFRDHTIALFKKHGMKNWMYFHKMPDQPGADTTLIYFLAHKSKEAAKASFDAFRKDPDWIAAKEQSEKNGSLTVKDGVKSLFLVPAHE